MLDLIAEEDVACSIHESGATTSIVLKSKDIARAGFTIVKSRQTVLKTVKSAKNKMSTNRVRQATTLGDSGLNQNSSRNTYNTSNDNNNQHYEKELETADGQIVEEAEDLDTSKNTIDTVNKVLEKEDFDVHVTDEEKAVNNDDTNQNHLSTW